MQISKNAVIAGVILVLIAGATTVGTKEVGKRPQIPFDPDQACDFFLQETTKHCQAPRNKDCAAWRDTLNECKENAGHIEERRLADEKPKEYHIPVP